MKLNRIIYLYSIEYLNMPIYIGSTSDIKKRTKDHNFNLIEAKNKTYCSTYLYDFLKTRIDKIELKEITTCYDDIVIVGNNKFEYRRFIEEEKLINYCFSKGSCLLNMRYPCKFWFDNNNLIERTEIDDFNINVNNYKINVDNPIYHSIYNFIINKNPLEKIIQEPINKNAEDLLFNNNK